MNFDFPFHFNDRSRTASTDDEDHIRDMIEQVLFIAFGERVNRPDFGCGPLNMVFVPNSDELAAATQFWGQAGGQVFNVRFLNISSSPGGIGWKR
jgi:phage baseplate assembly protein W